MSISILKIKKLLDEHPLNEKFDFVRSEKHLYEILPKGSNKGVAIKELAKILETDKTIAIGDFYNDIPMFKISDECYAVANAVDELKKISTSTIDSNTNDAVAKFIHNKTKKII